MMSIVMWQTLWDQNKLLNHALALCLTLALVSRTIRSVLLARSCSAASVSAADANLHAANLRPPFPKYSLAWTSATAGGARITWLWRRTVPAPDAALYLYLGRPVACTPQPRRCPPRRRTPLGRLVRPSSTPRPLTRSRRSVTLYPILTPLVKFAQFTLAQARHHSIAL